MTKIGILDDEVLICETLSKYLKELGYAVPEYAMTFEEGVALLKQEDPDVMLLDINISGALSGIDFARYIRENYQIPLIFVSSYSDKATIDAVKATKPNGYLVKPFTKDDLYAAIEVAINSFSEEQFQASQLVNGDVKIADAIFIKQDSLFVKVLFSEISYIKSDGVYLEIHTRDQSKFVHRETLKNMLDWLPNELFYQVHRSYIVNLQQITALNSEFVVIGKDPIPLSKSQKELLLAKLTIL